jgi:hypothetical protein
VGPDYQTWPDRASSLRPVPKGAGPTDQLHEYLRRSGGLISDGVDLPDMYRQAGVYTSRIQGHQAGRFTDHAAD